MRASAPRTRRRAVVIRGFTVESPFRIDVSWLLGGRGSADMVDKGKEVLAHPCSVRLVTCDDPDAVDRLSDGHETAIEDTVSARTCTPHEQSLEREIADLC